jgi:hypothetical protein
VPCIGPKQRKERATKNGPIRRQRAPSMANKSGLPKKDNRKRSHTIRGGIYTAKGYIYAQRTNHWASVPPYLQGNWYLPGHSRREYGPIHLRNSLAPLERAMRSELTTNNLASFKMLSSSVVSLPSRSKLLSDCRSGHILQQRTRKAFTDAHWSAIN